MGQLPLRTSLGEERETSRPSEEALLRPVMNERRQGHVALAAHARKQPRSIWTSFLSLREYSRDFRHL
jgi:hypothetical protein